MKIETLHVIPEMERNDSDDGFVYPEKFRNRLFIYQESYIFFKEASYDTFPKGLIETVLQSALEDVVPTLLKEMIPEAPAFEPMDTTAIDERLDTMVTKDHLDKLVEERMGEVTNNLNRVIDNINDKVNGCPSLKDIQEWRTAIENGVNNLVQENIQKLPEDSYQSMNNSLEFLKHKVSELNGAVTTLEKAGFSDEALVNTIHKELEVVYQGIDKMVHTAINEHASKLSDGPGNPGIAVPSPVDGKVKLTTLAMLKESGFTMAEIREARDEGLI